MRVMLATICLNEMEWLPRLVEQHKDWPGLAGWCFVEGCDPVYAETNPSMVTEDGLSIDGTTEFLEGLDFRGVCVIHAGEVRQMGDQGKCQLRNQYLRAVDTSLSKYAPDVIVQIDADEFYTREDQRRINELAMFYFYPGSPVTSIMLRQRHIWRPPCWTHPQCRPERHEPEEVFSHEVVGGYWHVPHTRIWRYVPGMLHVCNHNWPEVNGQYLTANIARIDLDPSHAERPQCVHLGYASAGTSRTAKHSYYIARGEGAEGGRIGQKRSMYVECREAWERWSPGDELPHGARLIPYDGPIPEVFR